MAIYHFSMKIISRNKGNRAVYAAAYRHAMRLVDQREGKTHNFSDSKNIIHHELSVPSNSPSWVKDIERVYRSDNRLGVETLWNLVEKVERRKDAQLSRAIQIALPLELSPEQNIFLLREYIQDQFVTAGLLCDWCVNWDEDNPHVFLMLTMRKILDSGFGDKLRDLGNMRFLYQWREAWSEYANIFLNGFSCGVLIDHRSHKSRGIDAIPQKKRNIRKNNN